MTQLVQSLDPDIYTVWHNYAPICSIDLQGGRKVCEAIDYLEKAVDIAFEALKEISQHDRRNSHLPLIAGLALMKAQGIEPPS